jgi:large subunit ribosomal protein L15
MDLGNLKLPKGARRAAKRRGKGVGSGTGKTAGRGHKGQRSRSGARRGSRVGFEGGQMPLYRRLPKIGFSNQRFQRVYQVVNLAEIESRGLEGEVGPPELKAAGLIRKATLPVKILGTGALSRPLKVRAHAFSSSAREKIDAAGGSAERLENRPPDA